MAVIWFSDTVSSNLALISNDECNYLQSDKIHKENSQNSTKFTPYFQVKALKFNVMGMKSN
jgi:hypothetical protein